MSDQWFVITDLDDFTDKARAIVYNNFGIWNNPDNIDVIIDDVIDNEKEEFNKVLSHQESVIIVKELVKRQKNKKTQEIRYTLNDTIFAEIVHSLNDRMVSNIINSLVQKGLVETAFDDESNDFVFWVKDNQDENEKEKPETD
jgi:DNA-binding HxlR family transcriptional regulator